MSTQTTIRRTALAFGLLAACLTAHADSDSSAIKLQLDIKNGTYNTTTQTTEASSPSFLLYALQTTNKVKNFDSGKFFLSMALTPQTQGAANLGSFKYWIDKDGNGTQGSGESWQTILATSNMTYGTPPLEQNLTAAFDSGDLASHGVFPTYFAEVGFWFNTGLKTTAYDAQTSASAHGTITNNSDGKMFYIPFYFDLTGLSSSVSLHFDLYSEKFKTDDCRVTDIDVDQFAPFSHDAEGHNNPPPPPPPPPPTTVPDGGATIALFGLSLLGLGLLRRRVA